jgi:hypothetical protein
MDTSTSQNTCCLRLQGRSIYLFYLLAFRHRIHKFQNTKVSDRLVDSRGSIFFPLRLPVHKLTVNKVRYIKKMLVLVYDSSLLSRLSLSHIAQQQLEFVQFICRSHFDLYMQTTVSTQGSVLMSIDVNSSVNCVHLSTNSFQSLQYS